MNSQSILSTPLLMMTTSQLLSTDNARAHAEPHAATARLAAQLHEPGV